MAGLEVWEASGTLFETLLFLDAAWAIWVAFGSGVPLLATEFGEADVKPRDRVGSMLLSWLWLYR
jgi:hypothetical protein